jgi:hypothetical protein
MNAERIKMLEQFVVEDPIDPFNRYALALELAKSDKPKAKEVFDYLLKHNPDYVPTYYQAALIYIELNFNAEAASIAEAGISQAKKKNDFKAQNELRGLLDNME